MQDLCSSVYVSVVCGASRCFSLEPGPELFFYFAPTCGYRFVYMTLESRDLPNGRVIPSLLNIWCKCNSEVVKALQTSIYPVKAPIDLTWKFIDGPFLPSRFTRVNVMPVNCPSESQRGFFFFLHNLYSKGFNYLIWIIYLRVWLRDWGATIDLKDLEPVG